ncbi:MAG: homoserine kinase [Bacteroidetes bacterium]|nr:homoserine kinase [Bacteroidota bacterium]
MTQYTELNKKEINEIATAYDLELLNYEPIEQGDGSSNYLLHTIQNNYVLTVFEITRDRVANLVNILSLMEKFNFPTTRILNLTVGGMTTTIQGKPVLVKQYISGQVVKDLDDTMLNQIGIVMARLHDIPAPDFLADKHAYGLQTFPSVIGKNIDREYEVWLTQKHLYFNKFIPKELPHGLIHGDMFFDNVLFEGKVLKAVLDFEEVCQYYKVFDIGMGIVGLCSEGTRINLNKVRSLVNGYQQIRVLEKQEKENLQLFVEYAAIATSKYRFWKYNIDTPIAEKAKHHLQMVKVAKDVTSISKARFLEILIN